MLFRSNLVAFGSNHNFIELTSPKGKKTDNDFQGVAIEISQTPSFYLYYWHNSGFLSEFIKTAEFIVLVGIFEYFFFVSIVDKFKIANSHTLLCDGIKRVVS